MLEKQTVKQGWREPYKHPPYMTVSSVMCRYGERYGVQLNVMVQLRYGTVWSDDINGKIRIGHGTVQKAGNCLLSAAKGQFQMLRLTNLQFKTKMHLLRGKAQNKLG